MLFSQADQNGEIPVQDDLVSKHYAMSDRKRYPKSCSSYLCVCIHVLIHSLKYLYHTSYIQKSIKTFIIKFFHFKIKKTIYFLLICIYSGIISKFIFWKTNNPTLTFCIVCNHTTCYIIKNYSWYLKMYIHLGIFPPRMRGYSIRWYYFVQNLPLIFIWYLIACSNWYKGNL